MTVALPVVEQSRSGVAARLDCNCSKSHGQHRIFYAQWVCHFAVVSTCTLGDSFPPLFFSFVVLFRVFCFCDVLSPHAISSTFFLCGGLFCHLLVLICGPGPVQINIRERSCGRDRPIKINVDHGSTTDSQRYFFSDATIRVGGVFLAISSTKFNHKSSLKAAFVRPRSKTIKHTHSCFLAPFPHTTTFS